MRRDLVKIHFNFPYLILWRIFFQFGSMRWDLVKTLFNSPITCLIIKIYAVQFQSCLFHVSLATLPYRLGGSPQRHFVYTLLCFLCNTSVSHCLYFLGPPQCILALISLSLLDWAVWQPNFPLIDGLILQRLLVPLLTVCHTLAVRRATRFTLDLIGIWVTYTIWSNLPRFRDV